MSAALVLALAGSALGLDRCGRSHRLHGEGLLLKDRGLPVLWIDDPAGIPSAWAARGLHGRVVVSVSRRLNFVLPEERWMPPTAFPVRRVHRSTAAEGLLRAEGYLWAAVEMDILRQVTHLLPAADFAEKEEIARASDGVQLGRQGITLSHLGVRRTIASLAAYQAPAEPVLLVVNASIFAALTPTDLLDALGRAGLRTDLVVLSRSTDDAAVGAAERAALGTFAQLVGAVDD
ncbi:MAG: hypothetical protein JRI23_20790 [Deltaproteobacteria bacterium]|nr:hypothetical protein [Deltaproteobacteria bacterium]MBW2534356.1 hypothetical protein [Deltaproteobacteria bacterium]